MSEGGPVAQDRLKSFIERIERLEEEKAALLADIKVDGKTIAGFGAPAKATTLMYHFGIGPEKIDFIVDDSLSGPINSGEEHALRGHGAG